MKHPDRRSVTLGLAAAGALAALPARAASHAVTIKSFKFDPPELAVAVGDTVTFTNADGAPHTATADDGSWNAGRLAKGASAEVAFASAGEFPYHCEVHRNMKAVIRVG